MELQTKKHSFDALVQSQQASLHNSHLGNLASALMQVNADRQALTALQLRIEALAKRIEDGETVDLSEVKRLYDEAHHGKRITL